MDCRIGWLTPVQFRGWVLKYYYLSRSPQGPFAALKSTLHYYSTQDYRFSPHFQVVSILLSPTTMSLRSSQREFWSQRTVKDEIAASQKQHASQQSYHSSPLPLRTLPDLVEKAPHGDPAECDQDMGQRGKRRADHDIILEMCNKGASFIVFEPPRDPAGSLISHEPKGKSDFKAMERKGFLVTRDGCLVPYEHYCTPRKGATLKGHQRSVYYFTGVTTSAIASKKHK